MAKKPTELRINLQKVKIDFLYFGAIQAGINSERKVPGKTICGNQKYSFKGIMAIASIIRIKYDD